MKALFVLSMGAVLTAAALAVDSNAVEAFDNATVQPGGPRTGTGGKNFFNVEGKDNGNFASYGVFDVDASLFSFGGPVGSVTGIKIDLFQSNAGFTADGNVRFWLTSDTATDIQPGTSPLFFDPSTAHGIAAGQLGTLHDLGGGTFTEVSTGTMDSYSFGVSGAAATLLTNAVQGNGVVRVVITQDAGADAVAATWAGFSNDTLAGPTVTLTAEPVPEPASLAVLGVGALALLRRRKNRAA